MRSLKIENLRRPNFAPREFLHSDIATMYGINNIPNQAQLTAGMALADKMQEISDEISEKVGYRVIITITSGFRCPELNLAAGGSNESWHMQFLAADFNIKGFTPTEVVLLIKDSGVSVDKCFVERKCVHMQTNMNDDLNRNFFGSAQKIAGKWKVTNEIRKV